MSENNTIQGFLRSWEEQKEDDKEREPYFPGTVDDISLKITHMHQERPHMRVGNEWFFGEPQSTITVQLPDGSTGTFIVSNDFYVKIARALFPEARAQATLEAKENTSCPTT